MYVYIVAQAGILCKYFKHNYRVLLTTIIPRDAFNTMSYTCKDVKNTGLYACRVILDIMYDILYDIVVHSTTCGALNIIKYSWSEGKYMA